MRFLLDTHTFLWFYIGDEKLSQTARMLIDEPATECFLSIASIWEVGIKAGIGKLELRIEFDTLATFMVESNIVLLPIKIGHVQRQLSLPLHHRDPFDRLLIAQALAENLTLLSRDSVFREYEVPLLW